MTRHPPITLPDATSLAITTHGLTKRYGKNTALDNVSVQVPEGAVYLLVGPNGAGKSTLIKTLLDNVTADGGSAQIFGYDTRRDGARVRANIGYVPEHGEWGYPWLRVEQLLAYHAQFYPSWDVAYAAELVQHFQLRLNHPMGKLSKGQARRVHLAMSLAHRPSLLILDEPTDGLDPIMRDETLGILSNFVSETSTTVLMSTHHVEEVERLADHIGVLLNGQLRVQSSVDNVRRYVRRYHAQIQPGWNGIPSLNGTVLRKTETPNDVQWIVWGDESDVTQQFTHSNAIVRNVTPVSLLDAAVAFLTPQQSAA